MEMELRKGDVFACRDPGCPIEVEVKKGGHCRGLACCGQEMACISTEEEMLDQYEQAMRSECDRDDA